MAVNNLEKSQTIGAGAETGTERRWEEMVETALRYCEDRAGYQGRSATARALTSEVPQAHDYFRYSLARQAAQYLARLDDGIVAVYSHSWGDAEEEGADRSCSLTAPINLIIHVRRKTAALSSLIQSLDRALLRRYQELTAPHCERMGALLDVQMVDDREVEEGIGFGAVVKALYTRPTRIWPS